MPRKQCCKDLPIDVPAWFMTYSDVITLLMTFFILLLTFATNEPEHFEKMQVAMFGGGSSSGVAGRNDSPIDADSLLLRVRPKTARLTTRGSETPPQNSDPARESLDRGLKALDEPHDLADAQRLSVTLPLTLLVDAEQRPTTMGELQLRMIATQMRRLPLGLKLEVSRPEDVAAALGLADQLVTRGGVAVGRIAVAVGRRPAQERTLTISLTRTTAGGQ